LKGEQFCAPTDSNARKSGENLQRRGARMKKKRFAMMVTFTLVALHTSPSAWAQSKTLSLETQINIARYSGIGALIRKDALDREGTPAAPSPFVIKVQIALDRAGYSVGVIDGYNGENVGKAVEAFQSQNDLNATGRLDEQTWAELEAQANGAVSYYTLTEKDISAPLNGGIPSDYAEMAEMKALDYTSVQEMLAERFHMDEDLLAYLNPETDFSKAGSRILVADTGADVDGRTVARIHVNADKGHLRALDHQGALVVFYPATVGSTDSPSPSGTHAVRAVAPNPTYSYRPDVNFTQGDNTEPLTLPPGPNGPVGSMWIDLSEPTYGIHGTPEPSKIDKSASHGCVRLTNWDAQELAHLVEPGTVVEFVEVDPQ